MQTSRNKTSRVEIVPHLFRTCGQLLGPRNLDWGGGPLDKASEYLTTTGVDSRIYDETNRPEEHNEAVLAWAQEDPVDTVTLRTLPTDIEALRATVSRARKFLRSGGRMYAQVPRESGSPDAETFLPAFYRVFGARRVTVKRGIITANNP